MRTRFYDMRQSVAGEFPIIPLIKAWPSLDYSVRREKAMVHSG